MIERLPKPEHACLKASYPELQWREVACIAPRATPLLPAHGARSETVGDGTDYSAVIPGQITFAEGGFHDVTGVKSEYVIRNKHHEANKYSLQLNTQFFNTVACANLGSPDPSGCFGWEQFAYDTGRPVSVFIEYWLVDFAPATAACPAGWHKFVFTGQSEANCYINSPEIPTPMEPITSLKKLRLLGSAAYSSRTQDFAELTVGNSDVYYVGGQNWFPDLNTQWQAAEFNIFGSGNGNQAVFNAGSTITVRTEVDTGAMAAPTCTAEGFTGESNNLFLTATASKWPEVQYPSIDFTETNSTSQAKASCVAEGS
jgi:hypothetical protein